MEVLVEGVLPDGLGSLVRGPKGPLPSSQHVRMKDAAVRTQKRPLQPRPAAAGTVGTGVSQKGGQGAELCHAHASPAKHPWAGPQRPKNLLKPATERPSPRPQGPCSVYWFILQMTHAAGLSQT